MSALVCGAKACIVGSKSVLYRQHCLVGCSFREFPVFFFVCFPLVSECTYIAQESHCRDNSPGPRLCTRNLSVLQGMSSAVLTVTPCTFCTSSRKAAVATYSRAISGLRLALGSPVTVSGPVRISHYYRAFPTLRCDSTSAAAPAKATSQQVLPAWLHGPVLSAHLMAHTFI